MSFLEAVGGTSLIDPNSSKSDTSFALISVLLIYLIWSRARSQKGKPLPGTTFALISGFLLLLYALLFGNFVTLHIAVSLCTITIIRILYSLYLKYAKKEATVYYPRFGTAFVIYYIIFSLATLTLCIYYLFQNGTFNIFLMDESPLYVLSCPCSLTVSFFVTILYFFPYFAVQKQNHSKMRAIYLLNVFAGWTVIGWAFATFLVYYKPKAKVKSSRTSIVVDDDLRYKELYEYKTLYDNGIISLEEFEAKKKQILGL